MNAGDWEAIVTVLIEGKAALTVERTLDPNNRHHPVLFYALVSNEDGELIDGYGDTEDAALLLLAENAREWNASHFGD